MQQGSSKSLAELKTKGTWEALGYDFSNTWHWEETQEYPLLAAFQGQGGEGPFSGGSGTAEDPYLISSLEDLEQLAAIHGDAEQAKAYVGAYYQQTEDIDLGSVANWSPIGPAAFQGHYDGQQKSINNLKIQDAAAKNQGLFSKVQNGSIKNVNLMDPRIAMASEGSAWSHFGVGALAGTLGNKGSIEGCSVQGGSIDSPLNLAPCNVGGLVGLISLGTADEEAAVKNSYTSIAINSHASNPTGGIAGLALIANLNNVAIVAMK